MKEVLDIVSSVIHNIMFVITVIVFTTYFTLMVFSAVALRKYLRKNSYVDFNWLITSPITPSISVIAPAYNESVTIVDNIRTLLSLYYNNVEIVVVNDGSTDDSLQKIIEAYELEKVNYYFDYRLPCERIRGIYKSRNRSFKKLMVIDKRNGGKADALNAGLNVVKNDLVVSIDADSIMEQDALLKLVKPFLEEKDEKVIGAGGVIRIANSCEIYGGKIKKIHLPKKWLPRAQVMEYTRSFLMGRIAWSELDGLLLISGALGMFDREVVIEAGGYSTGTVGEDMELVVRIRRYMADRGIPYKVVYIPDPLCWTEVPSNIKSLARQRSRWTRGMIETLFTHRKLFLNRKYGKLGLLGYPFWFFFEWLAPILEFVGILIFASLAVAGKLNVPFFLLLLGFVYFYVVSLSIWSVLFEEITFHKYEKRRDVLKLMFTAFLEPILFHPVVLVMNIKGNVDKLFGKTSWGKQERHGFNGKIKSKAAIRKRRIIYGISGTLAAAAVSVFLLFSSKFEFNSKQSEGQVFSEEKISEQSEIVQVQQERDPAITISVDNPIEINQPEDTAMTGQVENIESDRYFIIAGSFKNRSYAEKMAADLTNRGYSIQIIEAENSFKRISLASFSSRRAALDSLAEIQKGDGLENSWIFYGK